jgi:hypothetical protein
MTPTTKYINMCGKQIFQEKPRRAPENPVPQRVN